MENMNIIDVENQEAMTEFEKNCESLKNEFDNAFHNKYLATFARQIIADVGSMCENLGRLMVTFEIYLRANDGELKDACVRNIAMDMNGVMRDVESLGEVFDAFTKVFFNDDSHIKDEWIEKIITYLGEENRGFVMDLNNLVISFGNQLEEICGRFNYVACPALHKTSNPDESEEDQD